MYSLFEKNVSLEIILATSYKKNREFRFGGYTSEFGCKDSKAVRKISFYEWESDLIASSSLLAMTRSDRKSGV